MGIFKQRGVNALSADQTSQVIISDVRNYVRNSPAIEHIWGQQMSKITTRRHNIGPNINERNNEPTRRVLSFQKKDFSFISLIITFSFPLGLQNFPVHCPS